VDSTRRTRDRRSASGLPAAEFSDDDSGGGGEDGGNGGGGSEGGNAGLFKMKASFDALPSNEVDFDLSGGHVSSVVIPKGTKAGEKYHDKGLERDGKRS
jgi:hypothetical protein